MSGASADAFSGAEDSVLEESFTFSEVYEETENESVESKDPRDKVMNAVCDKLAPPCCMAASSDGVKDTYSSKMCH